jgi:hypothetical protein
MKAYIYRAAFLCEDCAGREKDKLINAWAQGDFPSESAMQDSDVYPQGPYSDGGGEADSPQHCDHCDIFLQNPLTEDGRNYVLDAIDFDNRMGRLNANPVVREWMEFYNLP